MTVLAWLLLCVTVIQLGRSNYSIATDEGVSINSSFANSISPPIDRSQARRARRSVESELAAAEKAFADADAVLNATKAALGTAQDELKGAQALLEVAWKKSNGTKDRLDEATAADGRAADAITAATTAKLAADTAYTDAQKAHTDEIARKVTPIKNSIPGLETAVTEKENELKKRKGEYDPAKKKSEDFAILIKDFNDAKAKRDKFVADDKLYRETEQSFKIIEDENKKITNDKMEETASEASKLFETKKREKTEIENNEILKGTSTELDKLSIEDAINLKNNAVNEAQKEYDKEANPVVKKNKKAVLENAQKELKFAQQLLMFNKRNTVGTVRKIFENIKRIANENLQNKILNGDFPENFAQKTVKEVWIDKDKANKNAKTKYNPATDDSIVLKMQNKVAEETLEREALNQLYYKDKSKTVEQCKQIFINEKKLAEETIAKSKSNDFLNGNIKDDFGAATIEQVTGLKKTAHEKAKKDRDDETDADKKKTHEKILEKAGNELKYIKELERMFGKNTLVKDAISTFANQKTEATQLIEKFDKNVILNGKIQKDYGIKELEQVVPRLERDFDNYKAAYEEKNELKLNFAKAEEEFKFINQLKESYGEHRIVEHLKSDFKTNGAAAAEQANNAFSGNPILKGTLTKFDAKIVAAAIKEQEGVVANADTATKQQAQDELDALLLLEMYDFTYVGELKKGRAKLITDATTALTEALRAKTTAQSALDTARSAIDKEQAKVAGIDATRRRQIKNEGLIAKSNLQSAKDNVDNCRIAVDTKATELGGQTGEANWAALETALNAETQRLKGLYDPAVEKEKDAKDALDKAKIQLQTNNDAIAKAQGKAETDAKTKLDAADGALARANAAKVAPAKELEEATKAHAEARAASEALERDVESKDNAVLKKKGADHDAMMDQQTKKATLAEAKTKKEDADREAERLEREHQKTVRMLLGAFGGLGGIVFCGVAIGLVAFFLMKRRKKVQKQKKSQKPEQPKYEEIDAPNGLTILRREGTYDKYVVLGKDIPFNGPLIHMKPPKDLPMKHRLEDQVGGDKIEDIFFDKNLNGAYAVGDGVEQWPEEDSVGITDGREMLDGVGESEKKANNGDKKSNRRKTPTKNPSSSSNDDQKKAATPSSPAPASNP